MSYSNHEVEKNVEAGKQVAKESVKDWYSYIQEHPLQSMLFGITIFYAVKGMIGIK